MKMTKLRWWIIGLVCVGTIVNYLSRSSLSVAAPAMMKELHFDEQQYSWGGERLPALLHHCAADHRLFDGCHRTKNRLLYLCVVVGR
nr:hexuronate transporter [Salmonella sp. NCTC 7297]